MKAILVSFFLASVAFGSGEIGVAVDRLTISSSKHRVEVAVAKDSEGAVSIKVTFEGSNITVPKEVMAQFPGVQLRSVRILTHVPTGHLPDGWLKDHPYTISFDYGDEKFHGREDHEVEVYARGRLQFSKAKYDGWEKFIPEGDFKNRWKIYQPMMLEGDGFNGTADGIECPLDD
jgi:hypothetical protein